MAQLGQECHLGRTSCSGSEKNVSGSDEPVQDCDQNSSDLKILTVKASSHPYLKCPACIVQTTSIPLNWLYFGCLCTKAAVQTPMLLGLGKHLQHALKH